MSDQKVILLETPVSMFAMRVKIALAEKGIEFESKVEDLLNKSPLLLQMNPVYKKIPVLIHNGKPISESAIIVEYIDEFWNDKSPLLPSDPYKRAQARFWADYIDKKIYDNGNKIIPAKGEDLEVAKKNWVESVKVVEAELGEEPYFGGESFGYLDVALISFYSWFCAFEKLANFTLEQECPKLDAWAKRCMQRDSVSKSLAATDTILNYIAEAKRRYGLA